MPAEDLFRRLEDALARYPRLRSQKDRLRIQVDDGVVVVEGEVDGIAAKRMIPRILIGTTGGLGVLDKLRLVPEEQHSDGDIGMHLQKAFATERLFDSYTVRSGDGEANARDSSAGRIIAIDIEDGVIRLSGVAASLRHRRLAEVLAWWIPGCRDVDNQLYVSPTEIDSDVEITGAVRLVLERDSLVDADHVAVRTHNQVVRLIGALPEQAQRERAEEDVWCIPGVHGVDNRIHVRDQASLQETADEASRESFPASDPPALTPVIGLGGADRS